MRNQDRKFNKVQVVLKNTVNDNAAQRRITIFVFLFCLGMAGRCKSPPASFLAFKRTYRKSFFSIAMQEKSVFLFCRKFGVDVRNPPRTLLFKKLFWILRDYFLEPIFLLFRLVFCPFLCLWTFIFRNVARYITKNKTPNKLNFPFSSPCGGSPEGEGG